MESFSQKRLKIRNEIRKKKIQQDFYKKRNIDFQEDTQKTQSSLSIQNLDPESQLPDFEQQIFQVIFLNQDNYNLLLECKNAKNLEFEIIKEVFNQFVYQIDIVEDKFPFKPFLENELNKFIIYFLDEAYQSYEDLQCVLMNFLNLIIYYQDKKFCNSFFNGLQPQFIKIFLQILSLYDKNNFKLIEHAFLFYSNFFLIYPILKQYIYEEDIAQKIENSIFGNKSPPTHHTLLIKIFNFCSILFCQAPKPDEPDFQTITEFAVQNINIPNISNPQLNDIVISAMKYLSELQECNIQGTKKQNLFRLYSYELNPELQQITKQLVHKLIFYSENLEDFVNLELVGNLWRQYTLGDLDALKSFNNCLIFKMTIEFFYDNEHQKIFESWLLKSVPEKKELAYLLSNLITAITNRDHLFKLMIAGINTVIEDILTDYLFQECYQELLSAINYKMDYNFKYDNEEKEEHLLFPMHMILDQINFSDILDQLIQNNCNGKDVALEIQNVFYSNN